MSRGLGIAAVGALIALGVVAAAALREPEARRPERDRIRTVLREAPWVPVAISEDQRTLRLLFDAGGCRSDRGQARVRETGNVVAVTVRRREVVTTGNVGCALYLTSGTVTVRLRRPLAGRWLVGNRGDAETSFLDVRGRVPHSEVRVPRVVGLQGSDARDLLEHRWFRDVAIGTAGQAAEATGTEPPAGSWLPLPRPPQVTITTR